MHADHHTHSRDHGDTHSHEHGHHHHGHSHGTPPPSAEGKPVGLAALVLLGISGGIVPCPAALAILLASASVGNLGKGLALTLIFSLGLALSLVAIGMVIVSGVKGAERFVDTEKFAPQVAFASALVVTAVGAYTLYSSLGHLRMI